ncbi:MAG: nucleotidyltransferase domain-containing protein [Clostridia bacterium]|nr:nucleotidyltransferase domain-containing protein [Clostridia bacterium]
MPLMLKEKASEIMALLNDIPGVKKCNLYGSVAKDTYDELSDIDIEIDVSGIDNGLFMLDVTELLKDKMDIYYADYAPSLAPDKYIVSLAIDKDNPFLILDLCIVANPHCTTVTKEDVMGKNEKYTHILKLWTANLKHYVRGNECLKDILKMAKKIGTEDAESKSKDELLRETLHYLEANAPRRLSEFIKNLRITFDKLMK